jgi:hypothetical protein
MQDPDASRPVHVTAEERTHPAIRKLARAAIAIAREAIAANSSKPAPPTSQAEEVKPSQTQEGGHA